MKEKNVEKYNKTNIIIENIISNTNDKSNNSKIIINSKLDLSRISFSKILSENIQNFEGEYFKRLYEEDEKEEKKEFKNEYEIRHDIMLPISNKNNLKYNI